MNIDQRLEALTQSVERLAKMHQDGEKRIERLDQHMEQLIKATTGLAGRNARLESLVTQIAEGIARLLVAVEDQRERISQLEGNRTQQ